MRLIGLAERALESMCRRAETRVAFGKPMSEQTVTLERIAEARIMIEQSRLLTLKAAYMMDTVGNKVARSEIAMIKVAAPNMACQIIDWAIQTFGGGGTATTTSWRRRSRRPGCCEWPTDRTRCTATRSARLKLRRWLNTDPARTGGLAEPLSPDESEDWSNGGLWSRPKDLQ